MPYRHRQPYMAAQWLRRRFRGGVQRPLERVVGGPARLRVVVLLACVLALDAADTATVSALASQLERAFGIGNAAVGLLVSVSTGIGAIATLPIGMLVDRVTRTRLLTVSIVVWSVATAAGGASMSYPMLIVTRLALGAVIATAAPTIASLIGDFFPAASRGRAYGYILSGELIGAGVGFLLSGNVASIAGWRAGFWVLVPPGLALAWIIHRMLPEPARGGASQLQLGQRDIVDAEQADTVATEDGDEAAAGPVGDERVRREVGREQIRPHEDLVLSEDPSHRGLVWAVRYVLSVRTNRVLILASALGYFYFTGLRTFAVVYMQDRFGLGQAASSTLLVAIGAGALIGVVLSGRIADRSLANHHITARPVAAGVCSLCCAGLLVIALLTGTLPLAVLLFFLAAAALGGANPPLDAARLDIMHSRLWGRAESVRTVVRSAFVAVAPVLFGLVSGVLGGHSTGLEYAFLLMLVTLLAAGVLAVTAARRTYPRDVATALASENATSSGDTPADDRAAEQ